MKATENMRLDFEKTLVKGYPSVNFDLGRENNNGYSDKRVKSLWAGFVMGVNRSIANPDWMVDLYAS